MSGADRTTSEGPVKRTPEESELALRRTGLLSAQLPADAFGFLGDDPRLVADRARLVREAPRKLEESES